MKKRIPARCQICQLLPNCSFLQPQKCDHFRPIQLPLWRIILFDISEGFGMGFLGAIGMLLFFEFIMKQSPSPVVYALLGFLPLIGAGVKGFLAWKKHR
jgi:hypothetical protein